MIVKVQVEVVNVIVPLASGPVQGGATVTSAVGMEVANKITLTLFIISVEL